jgi:hypothetical protein
LRQFASSGFRIWNLSREAKLVYTGFGIFAIAAIFVSILFYEDMVGPRTAGVKGYYAGESQSAPTVNASQTKDGPHIEMPDEPPPRQLTVAVTYRKLLEVTHFHLFTVPVFLLIIAHLFMLTGLGSRAKVVWIAGGFSSSLLHLTAPWVIHYGSAAWSWLFPLSGALMAVTLGFMTAYPIMVMWARPPERDKD